jgi:hypothetical protein
MARGFIRARAPALAIVSSLGVSLLVLACGSGGNGPPASFSGPPVVTSMTDTGAYAIAARTSPNPIARGGNALELTVSDASGAPKDGLAIAVVPWMPAMGHGASVVPTVTPKGGGVYDVTDVELFMPGRWEVRLTIGAPATDHSTLVFDVP